MRYLWPHVAIALGLLGLVGGLPETFSLGLILGGHLAVPVWAAKLAPPRERWRAALAGPIALIVFEAALLVLAWLALLRGNPEDTWLNLYLVLIATVALVLYAVYCLVAWSIVTRGRQNA